MKNTPHKAPSADNIRQQAEEMLKNKPSLFHSTLSNDEALKLVHELEVHQIELEIQNETLLEAQREAQEAIDLYDFAPTGYFTLTRDGQIIRLNQSGANLLHLDRNDPGGRLFDAFITNETKPIFKDFLQNIFFRKTKESCEISLLTPKKIPFYIYLTGSPDIHGELCLVTAINITEQKQNEKILKQERELYQDIVNNQPAGIYRIRVFNPEKWRNNAWSSSENPPYRIELASDRFCAILKITRKEFEANPAIIIDLVHPEDKTGFILRNEKANADIIPFRWEGRLVVKEETIWLHIESIPLLLEDGEILWTGILYDITDQKRTEKLLVASEDRFQQLFNKAPLGYQSLDSNGNFLEVNHQWLEILGYTHEEVVGKWFGDFLSPDYKDKFRKGFPEFKSVGYVHTETKMIHKNGHKVDIVFDGRIGYDQNGDFKQTHCILQDITERRIAENEFKKSREDFKNLFDDAPVGYHEIDSEGRIVRINQTEMQMLGYSSEELIGQFVWKISANETESCQAAKEKLEGLNIPAKTFGREFRRKDGTTFPVVVQDKILRNHEGKITGIRSTIQDITERKVAENEINKSREDFKDLFEKAPVGYHEIDSEGKIVRINQTELAMLGYSLEELIGQHIWKYNANEFFSFEANKEKLLGRQTSLEPYERELLKKDGSKITVLQHDRILRSKDGNVTGIRSSVQNITERKKAELDLQLSEEKFRNIFENSIIGKSMTTIDGKVNVNKAFGQIIGYTVKELSKLNWAEFTHKDDLEFNRKETNSILSGEKDFSQWEKRYIHKSGNIVWVSISTFLLRDKEENPLYFITEIYDITERKKAEESLRESEELYRNLVLRIPDGVYKSTPTGKFIDVNPAMVKMLGYDSKEELLAINIKSQLYFKSTDRDYTALNGQNEEIAIFPLRKKDGSKIWVEDHGWYDMDVNGKIVTHEGVLRDITDRKLAEDILQEREAILQRTLIESTGLINNSPEGMDYDKITDTICEISGAKYGGLNLFEENGMDFTTVALSGIKENIRNASKYLGFEIIHKKWKYDPLLEVKTQGKEITRFDSLKEYASSVIPQKVSTLLEKIFNIGDLYVVKISKNNLVVGDFTLVFSKGETLRNNELVLLFANQVALFIDRDKKDKELRANEEKYRYLFANNPQPMYIYDLETLAFLEVNHSSIDHYGYSKEEFLGMTLKDIRPAEDIPALLKDVQNRSKTFKPAGIWRHTKKNGEIIYVDISTVSVMLDGMNARHVMIQDITERQKAEEALRESEDKYRTMIENSNDMIWTVDMHGNFTFLNKIALETTELILEEWKGKSFIPLIMEEDMPMLMDIFKRSMLGEVCTYELRFKKTDGNILTILVNTSPIHISGKIEGIVSFGRDITESKKALGLLQESEEKFRSITEQTGDLISIADIHGVLQYASTASKTIFQYEPEEMCGQNFMDFLEQGSIEKAKKIFDRQFEKGKSVSNLELKMKKKDNTSFYGEINGSRFKYGDNLGTLIVIRDMTERKKAQEELEEKMNELMRFQNLTVGREMTMIELKKEVNELLKVSGQKEKYKIVQ